MPTPVPPTNADAPHVRTATDDDAQAVADVHYRAWRASYAPIAPASVVEAMTPEATKRLWSSVDVDGPDGRVLVAFAGDALVGFTAVGSDGTVDGVYIDPAHQRAGHASRLMAQAARYLAETGATLISTWVPTVDTARLEFFKANGLAPTRRRRTLADDDAAPLLEIELAARLPSAEELSAEPTGTGGPVLLPHPTVRGLHL